MKRKPLSQKLRFEVFKRDNFTCQYCGRMAPDVLLHVDHIYPVSEGGTNDILNLVTSCSDCNIGKGSRKLNENQELKKQQEQLKELNEKRNQLEMLIQWKKKLSRLEFDQVRKIEEAFIEETDVGFSNIGINKIKALIKKYGFNEVYESAILAVEKYEPEKAFDYIARICVNRDRQKKHPEIRYINYLVKILKNRLSYVNVPEIKNLLNKLDVEFFFSTLKNEFVTARNYTELKNFLQSFYEADRDYEDEYFSIYDEINLELKDEGE